MIRNEYRNEGGGVSRPEETKMRHEIHDKAQDSIRVAFAYMGGTMQTSAQHALNMAQRQYYESRYESAHRWALKSLSYSVGILHPIYIEVAA